MLRAIDCTGTGTHIVENLDDIGSSVNVYHNDVLLETITTSTYTMSGCSNWEFQSGTAPLSQTSPVSHTILNDIVTVIVIIGLIVFVAVPTLKGQDLNWTTKEWMLYFFLFLMYLVFLVVLLQQIAAA